MLCYNTTCLARTLLSCCEDLSLYDVKSRAEDALLLLVELNA